MVGVKLYDVSGREIEWEKPKPFVYPVESLDSKKVSDAIAESLHFHDHFHEAERKWELEQFGIIEFGVNGIRKP